MFSFSPDINYVDIISIDPQNKTVKFDGKIDEFPAFEMDANGKKIFQEPPPKGNTLSDLLGGANRSVKKSINI